LEPIGQADGVARDEGVAAVDGTSGTEGSRDEGADDAAYSPLT
jgi:hypothetical protein